MEPHPVPQNILDVEFKLFGAFSLKQFGKILIGSLIGVGVFLLDINPIIKIPIVLISVFTGILSAIIPNFQTWLYGFIKALFISPRYVWVKENQTPEILATTKPNDPTKDRNVTSALNKKRLDIEELPLDKLFGTTVAKSGKSEQSEYQNVEGKNLTRVYGDVFGKDVNKATEVPKVQSAPKVVKKSSEEYQSEINHLKFELSKVSKDPRYKDKELEILNEINDLYAEIKLQQGEYSPVAEPAVYAKQRAIEKPIGSQVVFGIVVDKQDKPLQGVKIDFVNISNNDKISTLTAPDGKFSSPQALQPGDYAVTLQAANRRFHGYKISIAGEPLPGYKLREK